MAILEQRHDNVEVHGGIAESGFSIMASAEAFEILSDRIYPNKIKAVIRELSTNAVDATIDARKVSKLHFHFQNSNNDFQALADEIRDNATYVEKEFETWRNYVDYNMSMWEERVPQVHLPNRLEPWFSVRDYGTGLSHEFITKLYTSYFWSDKKTSNDYTGCLGLGSKSPFAYTDHFTVTSFWNGEKRTYNAHLKNGFPAISIFTDDEGNEIVTETDEPNGLEVKFGVKTTDFDTFYREVRNLYIHFKMPLQIVGNASVREYLDKISKAKEEGKYYVVEGKKDVRWGIINQGNVVESGSHAIMGNISYPINVNTFSGKGIDNVLRSNIDIHFPVGSLQITPSREQLSYKESTVKAIVDAAEAIAQEIAEVASNLLKDSKSLWEARCNAGRLINSGELGNLANILNVANFTWNGQKLGAINYTDVSSIKGIEVYYFEKNKKKRKASHIPFDKNIQLYEIDMPRGSFSRCELQAGKADKKIFAVEFSTKQAELDFLAHLGMPSDTVLPGTSSLDKPQIADRIKYSNAGEIFQYKDGWGERQYRYWENVTETLDMTEGGVYVEMFRNTIYKNGSAYHPRTLNQTFKWLEKLGIERFNVYGVRRSLIKEFNESDDWVSFDDYVKKIVIKKIITENIGVHIANLAVVDGLGDKFNILRKFYKLSTNNTIKFDNDDFVELLLKVSKLWDSTQHRDRVNDFRTVMQEIRFATDDKPVYDITDEVNNLFNNRPMLKFVSSYDVDDDNAQGIMNYINGGK